MGKLQEKCNLKILRKIRETKVQERNNATNK